MTFCFQSFQSLKRQTNYKQSNQIHLLLEVLNSLLRELLLWFVKLSVIKGCDSLTHIDYKSSCSQRDDDDLIIGSQTTQSL